MATGGPLMQPGPGWELGPVLASVLAGLAVAGAHLAHLTARPRPAPRARPTAAPSWMPVTAATSALALDLVAATVAAGSSPAAAIDLVGDAVGGAVGHDLCRAAAALRLGVPPAQAWAGTSPRWAPLQRCLRLSETAGAPVSALMREAATATRRQAHRDAIVAASRLSIRIVLPLGLCALPAFFLTGVAPVVLAMAASILGS